ncbi:amidohydrolase [Roseomonas hellenica]|uniref:Amidohydrolase n=1 Tax=Plastoroseomonas hellenica TaxID=2687306 RepID=A0ABS5F8N9_9PROT|nr:amidohydrolase [Plastoroseomonas hellenica]MBR0668505.1 amidohydrolase [Plastoroseomonas hellenica]
MSAPAELLLHGGVIRTMDPARPLAEAIAIGGGRIMGLGSRADLEGLVGAGTRQVALGGRMAMPGIIDFHLHLLGGMTTRLYATPLAPADDFGAVLEKVAAAARQPGRRDWVVAGPYGAAALAGMAAPGALTALDAVSNGRPAALMHVSGHSRFANSRALDLAGIDAATPDPPDGHIVRDAAGRPTGLLHEAAAWPLRDAIPALTEAELLAVAREAQHLLNGLGITGFCDASATLPMLKTFRALEDAGGLTAWAGFNLALHPSASGFDTAEARVLRATRRALCGPHMIADFAKIFLDGVPSLRTAAMFEPYAAAPEEPPVAMALDRAGLADAIADFDAEGMGVKVHAIGDRAVRTVLDAVADVRARNAGGPQHQIAHGQFILEEDIPRLRALNVLADMNPPLWYPNAASLTHERVVGAARYARTWAIRDILAAGADVAVGSDWMTVTAELDPWEALAGLLTRRDPHGRFPGAHRPDQALTLDQALPLLTRNPARAMRFGDRTGALAPGLSADLILLDRDLGAIDPMAVAETRVLATVFEGKLVHGVL